MTIQADAAAGYNTLVFSNGFLRSPFVTDSIKYNNEYTCPNQTLEEIRPAVTTSPEKRPAGGATINENQVRHKGARGCTAARIQRRATPRPAAAAWSHNASSQRRFVRPAGASSRAASQHKCALRRSTGAPPTSTSASSIGHRRAQKRPASALNALSSSGAPSHDDSEKRRPSMRGQRACTARVHARGGAPLCAAAIPAGISIPFSSRF
ncbi:hypothetical protein F511_17088 [Dorcoceras hygrometricum]|uniref:Uncharacterized protein n=1 Tax=Dorcoceras hygrometricum TaxID=472368 RepID=A0A2Z7BQW5_9LAMI|nr:hypothetical protein F511_17088 [Dorcoceras hygrometricum]